MYYKDYFWDVYYSVIRHIKAPFLALKKLYDWQVNVFRYDYDFDAQCLFNIIHYKLLRVENVMKDGDAEHGEKEMQALRLAVKLSKRLAMDNYSNRCNRKHDAKWGELEYWTYPIECEGETMYRLASSRPKAVFMKQKEQERKDLEAGWKMAEAIKQRDSAMLFNILNKHLNTWWE